MASPVDLRWTVDRHLLDDVDAWANKALYLGALTLVRMFLNRLRHDDPVVRLWIPHFFEVGLREVLEKPHICRLQIDREMIQWYKQFVQTLEHPDFPDRRIRHGKLINGFLRFVAAHSQSCVRYGLFYLPTPKEMGMRGRRVRTRLSYRAEVRLP